ncbi:MAG: nucleoside hydrolase [Ornithinimicrobium sp.]
MKLRQHLAVCGALMMLAGCSPTDSPDEQGNDEQPSAASTAQQGRPTVFITDFGLGLSAGWRDGVADVDDAMALALALNHDELNPIALVTTFGNTVERPQATKAIPAFAKAAGVDVPVLRGSPRPVPAVPVTDASGNEVTDACLTEGIEALGSLLREHDDVAVLGIAPLSPLACLAVNDPAALESVTDVVALMGVEPSTQLQINGTTVSDFNFGVDVEAARIVVEDTDLPLTFITFETSSSSLLTTQQLDELANTGTPRAEHFTSSAASWVSGWEQTFGEDGIHPWDANTAWWLLRPEAYSCRTTGAAVITPDDDAAGSSIDDTSSHLYVDDSAI